MSFKLGWAVRTVGWAVQSLAAYLIPLALNVILAVWISEPETKLWDIANYLYFALAGLTFGILVAKLLPASTESGRWVWIGPVGLLIVCATGEMCAGRFDIISVWFGMGEGGPIKAFVTWPTLACCTYSAAMHRARRTHNPLAGGAALNAPVEIK